MKFTVSSTNELDTRSMEKAESDERLKQDLQHLMVQVRQKCLETGTAISTISSMQASSSQTAPQPSRQTVFKCNGATEPGPVSCRGSAATTETHNPAWRNTNPARRSTDSSITRNQRTTQQQRGLEMLDRPQEAGFGFETQRARSMA